MTPPIFDRDITMECGLGWKPLIRATLTTMRALDPQLRADQIKEKFGELRVYVTPTVSPESVEGRMIGRIAGLTALLSTEICEVCGEPGFHEQGGLSGKWWFTACAEHRPPTPEEHQKDKDEALAEALHEEAENDAEAAAQDAKEEPSA